MLVSAAHKHKHWYLRTVLLLTQRCGTIVANDVEETLAVTVLAVALVERFMLPALIMVLLKVMLLCMTTSSPTLKPSSSAD